MPKTVWIHLITTLFQWDNILIIKPLLLEKGSESLRQYVTWGTQPLNDNESLEAQALWLRCLHTSPPHFMNLVWKVAWDQTRLLEMQETRHRRTVYASSRVLGQRKQMVVCEFQASGLGSLRDLKQMLELDSYWETEQSLTEMCGLMLDYLVTWWPGDPPVEEAVIICPFALLLWPFLSPLTLIFILALNWVTPVRISTFSEDGESF